MRVVAAVLCVLAIASIAVCNPITANGLSKDVKFLHDVIAHKVQFGSAAERLWNSIVTHPNLNRNLQLEALSQIESIQTRIDTDMSRTLRPLDLSTPRSAYTLNTVDPQEHREHARRGLALLDRLERRVSLQHPNTYSPVLQSNAKRQTNDYNFPAIFVEFPLTSNFLALAQVRFLTELLDDYRNATVNQFVQLFASLNTSLTMEEKDGILRELMTVLQQQTITNPPVYVSHGTDHSVRAMGFALSIGAFPEIVAGLSQYSNNSDNKRFLLMFNSLLHDIGYIDINNHNVPKWLHSASSAIMARNVLDQQTNGTGVTLLEDIAVNNITEEFLFGIRAHNLDSGVCFANPCKAELSGDPNDPSSATTPLLNGGGPYNNGTYFRDFVEATSWETPFVFVVRITDNLDAQFTRLSLWQRDPQLMLYLLRMYSDSALRSVIGTGNKTAVSEEVGRAREYWKNTLTLSTDNDTQDLVSKADAESFLHFYSNWIVEKTEFVGSTVKVQFRTDVPEELSFTNHPGVALYQVNRLTSSMNSLKLSPSVNFLDVIQVELSHDIPGLGARRTFPLRAFTKQRDFLQTNNSAAKICADHCDLTPFLTNSPEKCIARTNPPTENDQCNLSAFSSIGSYADLSYNVTIPVNTDGSDGTINTANTDNTDETQVPEPTETNDQATSAAIFVAPLSVLVTVVAAMIAI